MPRPEIDLVAYHPARNDVIAVECKSYFDSTGVAARDVLDPTTKYAKRYKMFNRKSLRELVLKRLVEQLSEAGLCLPEPKVQLAMAVGHFRSDKDRDTLQREFESVGWRLFTDKWLRDKLMDLALAGYDNSIAVVAAKLLVRTRK
jgi:hypothetical protein